MFTALKGSRFYFIKYEGVGKYCDENGIRISYCLNLDYCLNDYSTVKPVVELNFGEGMGILTVREHFMREILQRWHRMHPFLTDMCTFYDIISYFFLHLRLYS